MPIYEYKALSIKGKKYTATIDADTLQDAKIKLIRRQIAALDIEEIGEKKLASHLSKQELLNLTREISRLLYAGLPLFETLSALEEKYIGQKQHRLLLNLCDQVKSGFSLSQSLSKHPKTFDILYISMVANAEKTGKLSEALSEIAELISRGLRLKKQMISSLLYPAILSGFCLVVLGVLLFYVIPSLKELFSSRDLHPFTRMVFFASEVACNSKVILMMGALFISSGIVFSLFLEKAKQKIYTIFLKIPFFKPLFVKVAFVRFCRACASLIDGGVSLIEAFDQARNVMKHPELEKVIAEAEEKIAQGDAIHETFTNHPLIPSLVPRMIAIAEEGGKLPFMLKQIADIYEEELDKTLSQFASVAQPVLLLVLGAVIGFVLLSVLLPMTDVSSFSTA